MSLQNSILVMNQHFCPNKRKILRKMEFMRNQIDSAFDDSFILFRYSQII